MTNGSQSSIWRWVLVLLIVVVIFGPATLRATPPNKSGTNEAAYDSQSDPQQESWPNPDERQQGWWIHPCCI